MILYSLGNFIFDADSSPTNQGILTTLHLHNNKLELGIVPFTLFKNRPVPMNAEEGDLFVKKIAAISPTVMFQHENTQWLLKKA